MSHHPLDQRREQRAQSFWLMSGVLRREKVQPCPGRTTAKPWTQQMHPALKTQQGTALLKGQSNVSLALSIFCKDIERRCDCILFKGGLPSYEESW